MKVCTACNRTYTDKTLNFCLEDGSPLIEKRDEAPPTIFMNQPRVTDQTSWKNVDTSQPWQNASNIQPASPMFPEAFKSADQTLPVISLILGVSGVLLSFCCFAGIPLGAAAMITAFLGMNNAGKDPLKYSGRGLAIGGLVLGAIAFLISMLMFLIGIVSG